MLAISPSAWGAEFYCNEERLPPPWIVAPSSDDTTPPTGPRTVGVEWAQRDQRCSDRCEPVVGLGLRLHFVEDDREVDRVYGFLLTVEEAATGSAAGLVEYLPPDPVELDTVAARLWWTDADPDSTLDAFLTFRAVDRAGNVSEDGAVLHLVVPPGPCVEDRDWDTSDYYGSDTGGEPGSGDRPEDDDGLRPTHIESELRGCGCSLAGPDALRPAPWWAVVALVATRRRRGPAAADGCPPVPG